MRSEREDDEAAPAHTACANFHSYEVRGAVRRTRMFASASESLVQKPAYGKRSRLFM
jgi:hypothetical protein